jgi:DNA-binding NarL/FixJ family response regulator
MAGTVKRPVRSALIVSRSLGLCRLGKWLLRRLRVRYVRYTNTSGKELYRVINGMYPEVILFDASFFEEITPRKIGYLMKDVPGLSLAVFSMTTIPPERAVLFLLYGAKSYVDVSGSGSFWNGLKKIVHGNGYITPAVQDAYESLPDVMPEPRLDAMGRLEDVKHLIFKGKKTKEIAAILKVSKKTVENHKTVLFKRYGVKTALELFRICYLLGELDKDKLTA